MLLGVNNLICFIYLTPICCREPTKMVTHLLLPTLSFGKKTVLQPQLYDVGFYISSSFYILLAHVLPKIRCNDENAWLGKFQGKLSN